MSSAAPTRTPLITGDNIASRNVTGIRIEGEYPALATLFADLVRAVDEVLPVRVLTEAELTAERGISMRPSGWTQQFHPRFSRRTPSLGDIALQAGADNVLPRVRSTATLREYVVQAESAG